MTCVIRCCLLTVASYETPNKSQNSKFVIQRFCRLSKNALNIDLMLLHHCLAHAT